MRTQLEARCGAKNAQRVEERLTSSQAPLIHPLIVTQLGDLAAALVVVPSDDRELWVRMGMALKTLGDAAKPLWHEWSAKSTKYDAEDADRTWASFQPDRTGYEAVFVEAKRWGWEGQRQLMPDSRSHPVPIDMKALPKIPPVSPFIIPGWLLKTQSRSFQHMVGQVSRSSRCTSRFALLWAAIPSEQGKNYFGGVL